jgi:hypothetical protein
MKNGPNHVNHDSTYDKIRHLVEVDDDILAVFSLLSTNINELYIAENANIKRNYIDSIVSNLGLTQTSYNEKLQEYAKNIEIENEILGKLKWVVVEYENIRILKIYESNKTIFVLIKSNTSLQHTVDNILGYYYDLDETPKSLF